MEKALLSIVQRLIVNSNDEAGFIAFQEDKDDVVNGSGQTDYLKRKERKKKKRQVKKNYIA